MLTRDGVSLLLRSPNAVVDVDLFFQVIGIEAGISQAGHRTLSLTLSDGNQFIDCNLSRTMFNLIDQCKCTIYNVVQVNKFTTNHRRDDSVAIFILDISVSESMDDVLGEPVCYTNVRSTSISITPDDCGVNVRHKSALSENVCTAPSNTFKCQFCEDENCEWSKFGKSVIDQVRDEYVGRIVDESGNIVDGHDGGTVVGNKQLRFIAYSVFTSMKHGYLGKRNRVQLPNCVEHGIRDTFPDSNKSYTGFKSAKII
jgi:hypothetical protein